MTKSCKTTCQKPPFRERALDKLIAFSWILLFPLYIVGIVLPLIGSPIVEILGTYGTIGFIGISAFFAWRVTFWAVCQKYPRLYPIHYLLIGFDSKRLWNRPPLYFYTEAFQKDFKKVWQPYLIKLLSGASFTSFDDSSTNYIVPPSQPQLIINPGSGINIALNNFSDSAGTPNIMIAEYKHY